MTDKLPKGRAAPGDMSAAGGERLVYVMPEHFIHSAPDDEIDLRELWRAIWVGKRRVMAVTALFMGAAVAYAFLATEWYRAESLLAPAEERTAPSLPGQLGGLAALAGVSISGGDSVEAVATLKSRDFAREFIEDHGLVTVLLANEWDEVSQHWREKDPRKQPDVRDAVRYFHEKVLKVSEDRQTSLVTLAIEWKDPQLAAEWSTALAKRLNDRLREQALRDAEANVEYLRQELAATNVVALQQAMSSLLESELQKLMLARGNEEFAFRIIDKAEPPKESVRPRKALVVILGTMLGFLLGLAWVAFSHLLQSRDVAT